MKNKNLGGIAIVAIAAVAAWNVNLNAQKSDLSDLALANVEALAGESSNGYFVINHTTTSESRDERGCCIFVCTTTSSCMSGGSSSCPTGTYTSAPHVIC